MADTYLDLGTSQFKEDLASALKHYDPHYLRYSKVPLDVLFPYGCADSDFTLALKYVFMPLLETEDLLDYFNNITMPLQHALMCMELQGVPLDIERAQQVVKEQKAIMDQLEPLIYQAFNKKFDIGSPKQLGRVLFEELRIPGGFRNKTGWVVDSGTLKKLQHPIMDVVRQPLLDWRRAAKIYSTYAVASLKAVREITDGGRIGWVHCTYWMDSKTSRLKPTDPNMSTLPRPENGGTIVKSMYAPNENYRFIFKDYSQIELRVTAHASREPIWLEGFNKGYDMHAAMAHKVFKLDCDIGEVKEKYGSKRSAAKTINFGILYGESAWALAPRIGMTPEEAQDFIENEYFGAAVTLKNWIDSVHQYAIEMGYVTSFFKRRRHLPDAQLMIPQSMKWPEIHLRPACYRSGPILRDAQIDLDDVYDLDAGNIRGALRTHALHRFPKCIECQFVKSCIINREVKYIKGRVNAALRQSVNFPIQSTAVDITSLALIWITQEFLNRGLDAVPVNHGHDELGVLSHVSCIDEVCKIMDDCMVTRMQDYIKFSVPLEVDTAIAYRWSDKHDKE
jgi:DNA polymerase I-like protein with 3'-5' exonuclease and polymerase domains